MPRIVAIKRSAGFIANLSIEEIRRSSRLSLRGPAIKKRPCGNEQTEGASTHPPQGITKNGFDSPRVAGVFPCVVAHTQSGRLLPLYSGYSVPLTHCRPPHGKDRDE